jgi:pantoate--beta-alanine ligase
MRIFETKAAMRDFSREQRAAGRRVGFVPTMGYLHEGHLQLVECAKASCDVVVVSIYVNPTQFSQNEDFGTYPTSLDADKAKLENMGCDGLLLPSGSLYSYAENGEGQRHDQGLVVGCKSEGVGDDAGEHSTWVDVGKVSQGLCSLSRPHFFRGVATVVTKLFHIVEPDVAYFGKKDYQQLKVITRLVRDLDFGITIVGVPISREKDGLARSSRNALLTEAHREKAPVIFQSLVEAQRLCREAEGEPLAIEVVVKDIERKIEAADGVVDYVHVVDADTVARRTDVVAVGSSLIAVAAFFGSVRLIDNIEV